MARFIFYIKLWLQLAKNALLRSMEFRANLIGKISVEVVWIASQILFFVAVFSKATQLKSWTFHEVIFFLGSLYIVDGIHMITAHDNLAHFGSLMRRGLFDFYLLRPVSSLFLAAFRFVNVVSLVNLIIGIALVYWANIKLDLSLIQFLIWGAYLVLGSYLVILLGILVISFGFWATQTGSLVWLFFELYRLSFRPHDLYIGWLKRVILSVFPAALFISVPVSLGLHKLSGLYWYVFPILIAILMTFLVRFIWSRGVRHYEGAMA